MSTPLPPPEFTNSERVRLYTEYVLAVDEWLKSRDKRRGSNSVPDYMDSIEKEKRVRALHDRMMNPTATPAAPT